MPYKEAMERFGTDKPDIRFGFELVNLSDLVENCGFKVFPMPSKRRKRSGDKCQRMWK